MNYVSTQSGYLFLIGFGVVMTLVTYFFSRYNQWHSREGFLVANRKVGWLTGGFSIAASWIWAPALFVSVQMAYQKGLAGIFWFTAPNVLALAIFAFLAPKIRDLMPEGYTLPQYIYHRFQSKRLHRLYLFPYFFYQIMAVTVQLFAGGNLVTLLTGIPLEIVMPILALIALTYTTISGLKASIITDFVQLLMIFAIGAIIIPLTYHLGGGIDSIIQGIKGLDGSTNIFDPKIAFSFGIVTSIGLIAGAISDQQYWQRSFAIKKSQLRKSFLVGALLFGIVPIALSMLGFIAANPAISILLPEGIDTSLIGVQTVATLLPKWALLLFVLMLLSGLSSTLDSGLSAASSLWVTDVSKKPNNASIRSARLAMVGITLLGLLIATITKYVPGFGLKELWWVFNTIAACVMVPTVLSLYRKNLSERGVFWGIMVSFLAGIPFFVYANYIGNDTLVVIVSLAIIAVSTGSCVLVPKRA